MRQHLRVVVEVAVLGMVAMIAVIALPWLMSLASVTAANLLCMVGLSQSSVEGFLRVTDRVSLVLWLMPFVAGFLYGLKRKLQLSFVDVLIGWVLGWIGFSLLIGATLYRGLGPTPSARPTLWGWLEWLLEIAVWTMVPALIVMWGQRVRVRRQLETLPDHQPASPE